MSTATESAVSSDQTRPGVLVISPRRHPWSIGWAELWEYRELLAFLAWRDVKLRYKQTALGASWAILQPLLTMIVFAILFGRLAGFAERTGGTPYPAYVFASLVIWTFFATAVATSASSTLASTNLITKVYFPRLLIPYAAVLAALVDFAFSFLALLAVLLFYGVAMSISVLLAPLLAGAVVLVALGVGAMLAALVVSYRDFRYVVPFLLQIWMFVTPVIYPAEMVPPRWRWALVVNPMAGIVEGFRAAMTGSRVDWPSLALAVTLGLILCAGGAVYFRHVERRFADVI